jgi:hypothetical protein
MIGNLWQTTSSKVPATYSEGEFAGEYNPADIRGSYSFGDIEEAFAVPLQALVKAFAVDDTEDPAAFPSKSLEEMYGQVENGEVGTDSVRWFVALYAGLPYTPAEDTLMPSTAVPFLQERVSEAELEAVRVRTVDLSTLSPAAAVPDFGSESETHTESEIGEVKGKTTFGELLSWGLSEETIEQILGLPIGKAGVTVRDYCIENGIEFSTVKDALQAAADQAQ